MINTLTMSIIESLIEKSPYSVKNLYVQSMLAMKRLLSMCGVVGWLDQKAPASRMHHYWRSLLAIHQLEDLIKLDTPWWTYTAIDQVSEYLEKLHHKARVFEYGSGASTLWLAKRAQSVISIEHDHDWYAQLSTYTVNQPNIILQLCPGQLMTQPNPNAAITPKYPHLNFADYVHSIHQLDRLFDLIVIDGRCRNLCFLQALAHLAPTGYIIFDNSNRQRYQSVLQRRDIIVSRFSGRVPGSPFPSETAIIQKAVSF